MSLFYKVGNFQLNTGAGNQTISGVGFQPKALLFFHNPDTVSTTTIVANNYGMVGMTDGTNQYSHWWFGINGSALEDAGFVQTSSFCIIGAQNESSVYGATIVSMNSDGFTINIENPDALPADTFSVGYVALGGSELSAKVGNFAMNTGTGSQAVTGVGFQPTALIGATLGNAAAFYTTGNANDGASMPSFGMSDGTNNGCIGGWLRDTGVSVTVRGRVTRNNAFLATISSSTTYNFVCSVSSFDADGFTLNVSDAGTAGKVGYLALSGVDCSVGTFITPNATTGNFTPITGLAFTPRALIVATAGDAAVNTIEGGGTDSAQHMAYALGFATAGDERYSIGGVDSDLADTSDSSHNTHTEYIARYFNQADSLRFDLDLTSFGASSVVLHCDNNIVTSRYVPYMVLGLEDEGGGGGNPTGGSGGASSPDSSFLFNMIGV